MSLTEIIMMVEILQTQLNNHKNREVKIQAFRMESALKELLLIQNKEQKTKK